MEELLSIGHQVFARFHEYGIKGNFEKVKWVSETIQFLGCEINNGKWSHENFLKQKLVELGKVSTIKDLERVIGVLSYARRCVKDVEMILDPLREGLKTFKVGEITEDWLRVE